MKGITVIKTPEQYRKEGLTPELCKMMDSDPTIFIAGDEGKVIEKHVIKYDDRNAFNNYLMLILTVNDY